MFKALKAWWFRTCETIGYALPAREHAEYAKAKAAYEVSLEETRRSMECIHRLATWKGPVGHA